MHLCFPQISPPPDIATQTMKHFLLLLTIKDIGKRKFWQFPPSVIEDFWKLLSLKTNHNFLRPELRSTEGKNAISGEKELERVSADLFITLVLDYRYSFSLVNEKV